LGAPTNFLKTSPFRGFSPKKEVPFFPFHRPPEKKKVWETKKLPPTIFKIQSKKLKF